MDSVGTRIPTYQELINAYYKVVADTGLTSAQLANRDIWAPAMAQQLGVPSQMLQYVWDQTKGATGRAATQADYDRLTQEWSTQNPSGQPPQYTVPTTQQVFDAYNQIRTSGGLTSAQMGNRGIWSATIAAKLGVPVQMLQSVWDQTVGATGRAATPEQLSQIMTQWSQDPNNAGYGTAAPPETTGPIDDTPTPPGAGATDPGGDVKPPSDTTGPPDDTVTPPGTGATDPGPSAPVKAPPSYQDLINAYNRVRTSSGLTSAQLGQRNFWAPIMAQQLGVPVEMMQSVWDRTVGTTGRPASQADYEQLSQEWVAAHPSGQPAQYTLPTTEQVFNAYNQLKNAGGLTSAQMGNRDVWSASIAAMLGVPVQMLQSVWDQTVGATGRPATPEQLSQIMVQWSQDPNNAGYGTLAPETTGPPDDTVNPAPIKEVSGDPEGPGPETPTGSVVTNPVTPGPVTDPVTPGPVTDPVTPGPVTDPVTPGPDGDFLPGSQKTPVPSGPKPLPVPPQQPQYTPAQIEQYRQYWLTHQQSAVKAQRDAYVYNFGLGKQIQDAKIQAYNNALEQQQTILQDPNTDWPQKLAQLSALRSQIKTASSQLEANLATVKQEAITNYPDPNPEDYKPEEDPYLYAPKTPQPWDNDWRLSQIDNKTPYLGTSAEPTAPVEEAKLQTQNSLAVQPTPAAIPNLQSTTVAKPTTATTPATQQTTVAKPNTPATTGAVWNGTPYVNPYSKQVQTPSNYNPYASAAAAAEAEKAATPASTTTTQPTTNQTVPNKTPVAPLR